MRIGSSLMSGFLFSILCGVSSGQIQRLIIPEANVRIPAGSGANLPILCTDYGIVGPTAKQAYGHVLTSADSARVTIGGKEMSLADAIRANKVRLVTPTPTVDEYIAELQHFNELDPTAHIDIERRRKFLESLTPSQRAQLLAEEQNVSTLRIENLSGQPITFVASNAAVGTVDGPPPAIPTSVTAQSKIEQTKLWTAQIQEKLLKRGYKTPTDGEVGPEAKSALLSFQNDNDLQQTGTPTQGVVQTLRRLDGAQWVESVPKGNYTVARLDQVLSEKIPFHLTTNDGVVKYHGALMDELWATLQELAHQSGKEGKDLYVEMGGFDDKEKTKILSSLQLANTDSHIVKLPSPEESLIFHDTYFEKGAKLKSVDIDSKVEPMGPRKGLFHSVVTFFVDLPGKVQTITVDLWTSTLEEMQLVLNTFRMNANSSQSVEVSIADVVAQSQKSLVDAGYSRKNLHLRLRDGTKRYVVELERMRPFMPEFQYDKLA